MSLETSRLRNLLRQLLGSPIELDLEPYRQRLVRINHWEEKTAAADDRSLKSWAARLRKEVSSGAPPEDVLEEVFAVVREASGRLLGLRPYDEQLIAGLVLHQGKVADMQTGEGKTLAAVAPVVLAALGGSGVHVLTFNDYLARRDARWMGSVYEFFGLSVGCVQERMSFEERRRAYACDVTYLTAKEAGFDFLRSFLCLDPAQLMQRPFHLALVDEADSILIDEARIPLVIAGSVDGITNNAVRAALVARQLRPGLDFDTDEHSHNIALTDSGSELAEQMLGCGSLYDSGNLELLADVRNALHAEALLKRDVDYIVRQGKVELVDDFTGRVADKRQWPDGLQAAIEAKERLTLNEEGRILGSITMQHFLRGYPKLCGMTATARAAAQELDEFYGLKVVAVPTHRPCIRDDHRDLVFTNRASKLEALVEEISRVHASGRPILVGTASVAESEELAGELSRAGIPCNVLNAKNEELEAEIVAEAGALGAVTISTNMAGRGTDIRLGGRDETDSDRVVSLGGLYVIGTNRHESRRVDLQLRGRSGRQGDPGSSRFFVSLEDPLLERYGVRKLIPFARIPSDERGPVDDPLLAREIARAQRIIEGESFDIRRRLFNYSVLVEKQRHGIQGWRQEVLLGREQPDLLAHACPERYEELSAKVGEELLRTVEKRLTLLAIDRCWSDHLAEVQRIRDGIHVVSFAGKDPLAEFFRETRQAHETLLDRIDDRVVESFESVEITPAGVDWDKEGLTGPSSTWTYLVSDTPFGSDPLRNLANRPGLAFWGVVLMGPFLFVYGLLMHWLRRSKRPSITEG
jgi:preprotein translocase subunit SecA